jgi:hypothetical protein
MRRLLLPLLLTLAGCSHYRTVPVPPTYDLLHAQAVGLVQFQASHPKGMTPATATQLFLQQLTQAQPGVRVLSLGTEPQVLAGVNAAQLDPGAVQAIGAKMNVQMLFVGALDLSDAQTSVGGSLTNLSVSANVTGRLTSTLYDTASGAVIWTQTTGAKDTVGGASLSRRNVNMGMDNIDNAYDRMIHQMTFDLADPFRTHFVKQQVD